MPKCPKCLGEYEADAKFCPNCGEPLTRQTTPPDASAQEPLHQTTPSMQGSTSAYPPPPGFGAGSKPYAPQPNGTAASGRISVGMLVWSILNTVLCSRLLGIIALVFTILAEGAVSADDEQKKLRTARILNVIATVIGIALVGLFIILVALGIVTSVSGAQFDFNF